MDHGQDAGRETAGFRGRTGAALGQARLVVLLLAVAMFGAGGTGLFGAEARPSSQDTGTPVASAGTPVADQCAMLAPATGAEAWVQSELYFGRGTDDTESEITDEEWQDFLDSEVTPRFPAGLTVLESYGQWQNSAGEVNSEDSTVLIILYPMDPSGATSDLLEEIRDAYEVQFDQESVLRTDTYPVCVGF
ncbi:MAG TPA: DUF3574 domain-containing protein [Thermomicrobiales bacterium]|jgi:hypothetical protein|nr:DUF3574 domain-containing protein [Thermomicrobiales bacterium]